MTTPQRSMTTAGPEQYAILIIGDADRWWTTMSQEERSAGYAIYGRFAQSLAARGHRVLGGAELHRTSEARTVRAGGSVSDGPFAETAEHVGGFPTSRPVTTTICSIAAGSWPNSATASEVRPCRARRRKRVR